MEKALRRLLLLTLLVAVLAGIEYFTAIDIPGFDLGTVQREVAEQVDIPGVSLPEDLPVNWPSDDVGPTGSSAEGEVEGPHVRVVSWNLYNWGRTKDDQEISVAAETLRDFDLVAVQEVVTSPPGAQAIGKLDMALDRTGFAWDYNGGRDGALRVSVEALSRAAGGAGVARILSCRPHRPRALPGPL